MTVQSWTHTIDHSSDAGFRAWGLDFTAKLLAVGLVKTADTGQIDWATVLVPAINVTAGYEIWRFDDPAQSSAPIFMKFNFGTDNQAGRPRILITLATGSDGVGGMTGVIVGGFEVSCGTGTPTGQTKTSYMSYSNGFFGFMWGRGGAALNLPHGSFFLARSVDANGDVDTHALLYWGCQGATSYITSQGENVEGVWSYNFDTPALRGTWGAGWMPNTVAAAGTTNAAGDTAAYLVKGVEPQLFPVIGVCTVWNVDVAELATFTAPLVGLTPHTYINLGESGATRNIIACAENTTASIGHCMLWE